MVRWCWINFPTNLDGPIALAVGTGGGVFEHFLSLVSFLFTVTKGRQTKSNQPTKSSS